MCKRSTKTPLYSPALAGLVAAAAPFWCALPARAQATAPPAQPGGQTGTQPATTPPSPVPDPNALPQPTPGVAPTMPPSTASRRPDPFTPLPYYTRRDNFFYAGAVDLRYRTLTSSRTRQTIGTYIPAARFTADYVRGNPKTGDERGGGRFQLLLENDNAGTALNRVRVSELYAYYRFLFPGVSANLRGGQFVLPFGLIAVWDTPLQPIQPLHEKAIGLRVDTGVMLEGDYGPYHYAGAITTGSGPGRHDVDGSRLTTFRLERNFPTRLGRFQVGGSLLSGRSPRTYFDTVLPPSGYTRAASEQFVNRTRFAVDGQYFYGPLTARGEIIFGSDDQEQVWGYFAEGEWEALPRLRLVAYSRRWNFPRVPEKDTALAAGVYYDLGRGITLRTLFEYERNVPFPAGTPPEVIRRLTIQTRLNF